MSSRTLANKVWRDCAGAILAEAAIMLPIFLAVALGLVDISYLFFDWARASKAVYAGAHRAVVSNPVAAGITTVSWDVSKIGQSCTDSSGTNQCASIESVCTASATSGACTNGYPFDEAAFQAVLSQMQLVFQCTSEASCQIQRTNVTVAYVSNGLGFIGQINGLPMDVTVSISCVMHTFFFMAAVANWTFGSAADGCPQTSPSGWYLPGSATTLTSEDMQTN